MNLTELQVDILKECLNIAVGHAATRYCEMTGGVREITMSAPRLKLQLHKKLETIGNLSSFYLIEREFSSNESRGSIVLLSTKRALLHFFSVYAGFDCDENSVLNDALKSEILPIVESFLNAAISMMCFQLKSEFKLSETKWLSTTAEEHLFKENNHALLVSIEFSPEDQQNECFMCLKMQTPGLEQFGKVLQNSFELTDSSP